MRDSGVNGVANPCRFARIVLEGIGEIVEVGRLVEHDQSLTSRIGPWTCMTLAPARSCRKRPRHTQPACVVPSSLVRGKMAPCVGGGPCPS